MSYDLFEFCVIRCETMARRMMMSVCHHTFCDFELVHLCRTYRSLAGSGGTRRMRVILVTNLSYHLGGHLFYPDLLPQSGEAYFVWAVCVVVSTTMLRTLLFRRPKWRRSLQRFVFSAFEMVYHVAARALQRTLAGLILVFQ